MPVSQRCPPKAERGDGLCKEGNDETGDNLNQQAGILPGEDVTQRAFAGERESSFIPELERAAFLADECLKLSWWLRARTWELTGLTLKQALLLYHIHESGPETWGAQVARKMRKSPHVLTRTLVDLEKKGLIYRRRSGRERDGRRLWISCTPLAASKIELLCEHADELLGPFLAGRGQFGVPLSEAISSLRHLLSKLGSPPPPRYGRGRSRRRPSEP